MRLAVTAPAEAALEFRYAISFISIEQAKKNLHREIPNWAFEQLKASAKNRWNKALGKSPSKAGRKRSAGFLYVVVPLLRENGEH